MKRFLNDQQREEVAYTILRTWCEAYLDAPYDAIDELHGIYLNGYNCQGLTSMTDNELVKLLQTDVIHPLLGEEEDYEEIFNLYNEVMAEREVHNMLEI